MRFYQTNIFQGLLIFLGATLACLFIALFFLGGSQTPRNYYSLNLLTDKYGVVCLQNKMYLVSLYPPIGNSTIYNLNKIVSQYLDEDDNGNCRSRILKENQLNTKDLYLTGL